MGSRELGVEAIMVAYSTLPERSQENGKREGRGGVSKHHVEFKSLWSFWVVTWSTTMPSDALWSFWLAVFSGISCWSSKHPGT